MNVWGKNRLLKLMHQLLSDRWQVLFTWVHLFFHLGNLKNPNIVNLIFLPLFDQTMGDTLWGGILVLIYVREIWSSFLFTFLTIWHCNYMICCRNFRMYVLVQIYRILILAVTKKSSRASLARKNQVLSGLPPSFICYQFPQQLFWPFLFDQQWSKRNSHQHKHLQLSWTQRRGRQSWHHLTHMCLRSMRVSVVMKYSSE